MAKSNAPARVEPPATDAQLLVAELRALRVAIADLRADLARQTRHRMTERDRRRLLQLLPVLIGAYGSDWFLCRDVFSHPSGAVRFIVHGMDLTPVRLGRLLLRGEGEAVDGYRIERGDIEINTHLWRVVAIGP